MELTQILLIVGAIVVILGGALGYLVVGGAGGGGGASGAELRDLMVSGNRTERALKRGDVNPLDIDAEQFRKAKQTKSKKGKQKDESIAKKLFRAGFYTAEDRVRFVQIRIALFAVFMLVCPIGLWLLTAKGSMVMVGIIIGALIGYTAPMSWLEKQIRRRDDEVMYFLPLVIEQVSIGVSSALDVGPCISNIVQMASERDSHNPVTEMFVHVEKLIRSGLNLEDALAEVAEANGTQEVKHAFMFLAQCSKHGGELSRQLQELADAVMTQRQVQIEGKIAALPVKATGPLGLVFAGFFALLFAGLFVRLMGAFTAGQ